MGRSISSLALVAFVLLAACPVFGRELPEAGVSAVVNWPAPLLWAPPPAARVPGEAGIEQAATASAPLPFIAITPCRVADTRGNGFAGQYGPPALVANATRSFTITGQCGIPASAAAVSFNFAALDVGAAGDMRVFPAGGSAPLVSTLNYDANTPNIANAAVVPLGTGGAITVQADATPIDLIIDVNGYYDGNGVITGVMPGTGMTGGGTSGTVSVGIAPGGVTSTELATNAVTSSKIAANAVTAGAIASGQVVKSLNGATDGVTVTGGGGTNVSTLGSTITVATPGFVPAGSFVIGNAGDTTLTGAGYTETGFKQDFWKATTMSGVPTGRWQHTAVWTGTKMIVWGGFDGSNYLNTGGQYDPAADSWTATTTTGAPTGRSQHTAVWSGSTMIVWGGLTSTNYVNTGGVYEPVGDAWTGVPTASAPSARGVPTSVWTGSKLIVWGGFDGTNYLNTGGVWNPGKITPPQWSATATTGAPTGRYEHAAVWTGTRMIVWGGVGSGGNDNVGGQYDPIGNTWTATTTTGAPDGRDLLTAVWTGSKMIVWGGVSGSFLNTGGQYDPIGDSWTATTINGAPTGRNDHAAVWTGSKMIVWGGGDNTGGQYDPVGDSWTATTTFGAPKGGSLPTAVWTGTRMIVWGGYDGTTYFNTGGQYATLSVYVKN